MNLFKMELIPSLGELCSTQVYLLHVQLYVHMHIIIYEVHRVGLYMSGRANRLLAQPVFNDSISKASRTIMIVGQPTYSAPVGQLKFQECIPGC